MTDPYNATVSGKPIKITRMDSEGNYLLEGGEKLWIEPLKQGSFRAWTLKNVSKLTFTGGEWMLDGENLNYRYVNATMKSHEQSGEDRSEAHTTFRLREYLQELSHEDRNNIKGVAWFVESHIEIKAETAESCGMTNDDLDALAGIDSHVKRLPVPAARAFRPVLLTDYQIIDRPQAEVGQRIVLGRFSFMQGFNDVWLNDEIFDLRRRHKAKACLQYLVEQKAFDRKTARHLEKEIDPFVREQSGGLPKVADIKVHHYFNPPDGPLKKLRDAIKPAGRNGRFYLKLT